MPGDLACKTRPRKSWPAPPPHHEHRQFLSRLSPSGASNACASPALRRAMAFGDGGA